jgi:Tol biopolymer transport system component
MQADGTGVARLTDPVSGYSDKASWSPDGARLAYVSSSEVWVMTLGTREAVRLTEFGYPSGGVSRPVWSLDGVRLLFAYCDNLVISSPVNLYSIRADGAGGMEQICGNCGDGRWSPLGTQIVYTTQPSPFVFVKSHLEVITSATYASVFTVNTGLGEYSGVWKPLLAGSVTMPGVRQE